MTFIKTYHRQLVILAIIIGSFLRLYDLGRESFRLDETQTIWQASHSLEYLMNYSAQNVHLPLFNILAHLWMRLGFTSETALRTLPVIFGIATLPFIYQLALEILKDKTTALAVLMLSALSPFLIWYSRETRPYSLMILFSVLSYLVFLRALKSKSTPSYLALTVVNILGLFTHYFFALVLFVEFLYVLFTKSKTYPIILSFIMTGAAQVPWLVYVLNHRMVGDLSPALDYPGGIQVIVALFELVFGFQPERFTIPFLALWPLIYLIGFLLLTKRKLTIQKELLLAVLASIVPTIVLVTMTYLYQPMFLSRYMSYSTPLILILITWLLSNLGKKIRYVAIGMFLILMTAANYPQHVFKDIGQKEDYRSAVAYIKSNAGYRDVVVVSPIYTIFPVQYYYQGPARLTTMPLWDRTNLNLPSVTEEVLKSDTERIKSGHSRIYLLATTNLDGGLESKNYLDNNYDRLDVQQFSEFIWVLVYKAEYPSESDITADAASQ